MAITLMRSRFQPFTKGHYEAIRSYYIARKEQTGRDLPEKLALCVIRDFDITRMANPLVGDKLFTGGEDGEELARVFRHLDFFNPFTAYETVEQIRHSLHCFATEDELNYSDPKYHEFIDQIRVTICPLKFAELIEALKEARYAPRHLERYVNSIRNRVQEVLHEVSNGVGDDLRTKLNDAFEESKQELMNNVLGTWARFTKDLLPPNLDQVNWLMPVFDKEDLADFNSLTQKGFTAYYAVMEGYQTECVSDLLGRGKLGLYGYFMQDILLGLVERNVIRGTQISSISRGLFSQLGKFLCQHCSEDYKRRIGGKIEDAERVVNIVPPETLRDLITNKPTWDTEYVVRVSQAFPDPYFLIICLLNILATTKFASIVDQIVYPDDRSIQQLDDGFKLELKKMMGDPVAWLEDAISAVPSELKKVSNIKKALAQVKVLGEDVKKHDLSYKIRERGTCLVLLCQRRRGR